MRRAKKSIRKFSSPAASLTYGNGFSFGYTSSNTKFSTSCDGLEDLNSLKFKATTHTIISLLSAYVAAYQKMCARSIAAL